VAYKRENEIPEDLILAQALQKSRQYSLSRKLYADFFAGNPTHYLRFKALFEIADNWFHEKKYKEAEKAYIVFMEYCKAEENLSEEELSWIEAYRKLSESRLSKIGKDRYLW